MAQSTPTKRKAKRKTSTKEVIKLSKPGDRVEGSLQDIKIKPLYSPRTKTTDDTRMYHFTNGKGEGFIITGRSMLDDSIDEIFVQETGGTADDPDAIARMRGTFWSIERGENRETQGGNSLGTYDVVLYE